MAIEGNKSGSFNGQYPNYATPYIFWSYEQSIPNNNTVLTAILKVKREKTGSTTYKTSTPWSITIGGTKTSGTMSFKISSVSAGEYITIGSVSKTFTHEDDGSINAISISATIDLSGTTLGTGSVTTSVTPNTIARASEPTLSATSVAMGSNVTITTNRKSDSFTHTLIYKFGSATGTIASGVGESTPWEPSIDLANQIPNGSEGTCTITCQTYNGSDLVGTKTVSLTLTVPSSVVPSISSIALSVGNSTIPSSWGVYVQGKSQLKVVTSASGSYGSSITAYKITGIDNNTYYSSSFTSSILQIAGTRTITVTVTDSRGRTATKTTTYTCVAYSNPTISVATVTRCNSDGTDNEEGEYVKYSFTANVAAVSSKNTYSYRLGYKLNTASSYTYITISNSAYSLSKANVVISGVTFSVDNSYDFQFLVNDYFTSTSVERNIGTGFTLMDFNASGKGMAIGKVSEKDALEIAMDMYYKDELLSLADFIKMSEILPSGISFDDLMITGKSSCYCISEYYGNTSLAGFPTGAYGYGTLITLNPQKRTENAFSTFQIYLTDGMQYSDTSAAHGMFIRSRVGGIWMKVATYGENGDLSAIGNITATGYIQAKGSLSTTGSILQVTNHGNTASFGSQNANWCHIYNSANIPFYFNRDIYINGYKAVKQMAQNIVANEENTSSHVVFGNLLICWGKTLITPSASNTPTVKAITFPKSFASVPMVLTNSVTAVPGTKVTGTSATNITTTGCNIYVTRTNTTDTGINWLAIGHIS